MWGWKKIFHKNGNEKKAGVAILTSDQTETKKGLYNDKGINPTRRYNTYKHVHPT